MTRGVKVKMTREKNTVGHLAKLGVDNATTSRVFLLLPSSHPPIQNSPFFPIHGVHNKPSSTAFSRGRPPFRPAPRPARFPRRRRAATVSGVSGTINKKVSVGRDVRNLYSANRALGMYL